MHLEEAMAWMSTLGGAFSSLGDYFESHVSIIRDYILLWVSIMEFDAIFSNISIILWRSVLLVEETVENHRPIASH